MKKTTLFLAGIGFSTLSAFAQISGTYTLGTPTSDYPDFQSALNDLYTQGINGATTFEIQPGVYNETVSIDQPVNYVGGFATIQFRSSTGNAADVVLKPSTSAYNVVFLKQNGITFHNVTMRSNNLATSNVWFEATESCAIVGCKLVGDMQTKASVLTRKSRNVIVEDCILIGKGEATIGIFDNKSLESEYTQNEIKAYTEHSVRLVGTIGSDVSFNSMKGQGLTRYGITMLSTDNVAINNNTLTNHTEIGISLRYDRLSGLNSNRISSNADQSFGFTGILSQQPSGRMSISRNYINARHPEVNRGIDLVASGSRADIDVQVRNNMITVGDGFFVNTGLSVREEVANVMLSHNTAHIRSNSSAFFSAAYFVDVQPGIDGQLDTKNNNFTNYSGGYAYYYMESAPVAKTSNWNNIYTRRNGDYASWNGIDAFDLAGFQSLSGEDANAVSVNPQYTSQTNLHVAEVALKIGPLLPTVSNDFDGDIRVAPTTAGCDELTGMKKNALATKSVAFEPEFSIYPNPAIGSVNIAVTGSGTLTVMDQTGRVVLSKANEMATTWEVETQDWASGSYIVRWVTAEDVATRTLIVR